MEAIWDYFYWQTLTTNALDDVGHVLRVQLLQAGSCLTYTTKPDEEGIDKCNQFLGPNQPGVTTPDPTAGSVPPASDASAQPVSTPAAGAKAKAEPAGAARDRTTALLDFLRGP